MGSEAFARGPDFGEIDHGNGCYQWRNFRLPYA